MVFLECSQQVLVNRYRETRRVHPLSPDGSVVYETRTRDMYVPRRIPGKGIGWLRFRLLLPVDISDGNRVKMTAHSGNCRK